MRSVQGTPDLPNSSTSQHTHFLYLGYTTQRGILLFTRKSIACSSIRNQSRVRARRLPGCLLYCRPWLLIGQLRVRGSNQPSDSGAQAGPDQLLISGAEDREKRKTGGKENHTSTACLARNKYAHRTIQHDHI